MSEYDMDYNKAPKSTNITLFYKHENFLFKWIRRICEIISLTYSYKHDNFLLRSIRGIFENNAQKNWRIR